MFWGVSGVALGSLLPWVDGLWEENFENRSEERRDRSQSPEAEKEELDSSGLFGADWTPVVRSVGAFVGIAFAIVRTPSSTGPSSSSHTLNLHFSWAVEC